MGSASFKESASAALVLAPELTEKLGVFDRSCPVCGPGRQSPANRVRKVLRIWQEEPGFVRFYCIRCHQGGYIRTPHHVTRVAHPSHPPDQEHKVNRERALAIWNRSSSLKGTLCEAYLFHRAITLTDEVLAADVLRYCKSCPFKLYTGDLVWLPAMIALMRDIATDVPVAIHRTALRSDGSGKAIMSDGGSAKRMLGPSKGAAIKLTPDHDVSHGLCLSEGIENGLTALCAGWRPLWAAGSAGTLATFPVLAGIEALTIFGDPKEQEREAAAACARRWQQANRKVTVMLPPSRVGDWNDAGRAS